MVDGYIPMFTIEPFTTISTLCTIEKYELYEYKDDMQTHKQFKE